MARQCSRYHCFTAPGSKVRSLARVTVYVELHVCFLCPCGFPLVSAHVWENMSIGGLVMIRCPLVWMNVWMNVQMMSCDRQALHLGCIPTSWAEILGQTPEPHNPDLDKALIKKKKWMNWFMWYEQYIDASTLGAVLHNVYEHPDMWLQHEPWTFQEWMN